MKSSKEVNTKIMSKDTFGTIFNIQRFSLDDGDGIRTCIFLKGCPLQCKWCHNPESQNSFIEISYNPSLCIFCGACKTACPNFCHTTDYSRSNCILCGKCTNVCYTGALEAIGKKMFVSEIIEKAERDTPFYANGGGITLTGGEPMAQFSFALAIAKAAKEKKINVVMETSGYANTKGYIKILPYCDCFYYDCKADSILHKSLTGVDDILIMHNLDVLIKNGAKIVLRCPIIPGANLTDAYIEKICNIGERYPTITGISLLPYHNYGIKKAIAIGKPEQITYQIPSKEKMDALIKSISERTKIPVW